MIKDDFGKFINHLRKSEEAVDFVKAWLESTYNYNVIKLEHTEAKTAQELHDNVDSGDLLIKFSDGSSCVVEVKRLSIGFTNINDWPYKNKFIVCERKSFDRREIKPVAYIILNKDMTHAAIIDTRKKNNWYTERKKDGRYYDMIQEFYLVPPEYVIWKNL